MEQDVGGRDNKCDIPKRVVVSSRTRFRLERPIANGEIAGAAIAGSSRDPEDENASVFQQQLKAIGVAREELTALNDEVARARDLISVLHTDLEGKARMFMELVLSSYIDAGKGKGRVIIPNERPSIEKSLQEIKAELKALAVKLATSEHKERENRETNREQKAQKDEITNSEHKERENRDTNREQKAQKDEITNSEQKAQEEGDANSEQIAQEDEVINSEQWDRKYRLMGGLLTISFGPKKRNIQG